MDDVLQLISRHGASRILVDTNLFASVPDRQNQQEQDLEVQANAGEKALAKLQAEKQGADAGNAVNQRGEGHLLNGRVKKGGGQIPGYPSSGPIQIQLANDPLG